MRVVESRDAEAPDKPWCRECKTWYWHQGDCRLGRDPAPSKDSLTRALEVIRAWPNAGCREAIEMQQLAAEALYPGRFPTPEHLVGALKEKP